MSIEAEKIGQVVTGDHHKFEQHFHNGPSKDVPDNIPPPLENFVGRAAYLESLIEDYRGGARCFVLHGLGGVGKTELARRFLADLAKDFEARVYVEMQGLSETPYTAERAMYEIVRQFAKETPAELSPAQLAHLYREAVQRQPTLVFLDNAADRAAVEPLRQVRACFVVTSREAFTLTDRKGGKHIEQMTPADARDLLVEFAGAESFADGEADELARLAGYLPMALRPLAALLAEDDFETARGLIGRYADRQKLLAERVPDFHDRTVAAAFDLSYAKISEEMQSRWRRLAVFPADFDEHALAQILEISAAEAAETQKYLRRLSLLEGNAETRRFILHDLVRVFLLAKLTAEDLFATQYLFARHYAALLAAVQQMQSNREYDYFAKALKFIDTEWINIEIGQEWTADRLDRDDRIAGLCRDYCGYAREFITLRLHNRTNIEWLEAGLKAARKIGDRQSEGNHLGNLGNAYLDLGEYRKAIDYYEQALAIAREIGHRLGEGNHLGNLGIAYSNLGEYRKAIEYYEQALAIAREIGDRLGEGNNLGNLGNAYSDLGEYRKAIEYHEQALQISREIGSKLGEGQDLGNLGIAYFSLGEKVKACGLWKEALAIFEAIESPFAETVRGLIAENCGAANDGGGD